MELPELGVQRALIAGYARVLDCLGELARERPLVLPTAEFFPDLFTGDAGSVQRLLERVQDHAGLSDMAISARVFGVDDASCGSGACGSCGPSASSEPTDMPSERLSDGGDSWLLNLSVTELTQPVVLTTSLVRGVTLAALREADQTPTDLDAEAAVDLGAVALGFGALALEGSYIYRKSCGGPSVARVTALGPSELAIPFALFVALGEHSPRAAGKHLSVTQREAFDEAWALIDSNRKLTSVLARDRGRVARGEFELKQSGSLLSRLFGGKSARTDELDPHATLNALEAELATLTPRPERTPKPKDPKLDEIRRLVDEALSETSAE
ncbi:MAG TPA: hypothetical protein VGM29_19385 [Polyangiaceae bacterium]